MKVELVGIGMGSTAGLTAQARQAIESADVLIGAERMLDAVAGNTLPESRHVVAVRPADIQIALQNETVERVCVLCSGDVGFYSLAASLRSALPRDRFQVVALPGITTVQYMAAKLGRSWQDCALVSAHGVACNVLGHVLAREQTFFLTGGTITPETIVSVLVDAGLGGAEVAVGSRLSYEDETIVCASASQLVGHIFDGLSSVWVRRSALADEDVRALPLGACGIPDDAFVRGGIPMTKQEVRACIVSKLGVRSGDVLFDVGAGTGSVSVELALASPFNTVFAVESDAEALSLIECNRVRFGALNIVPVAGLAPDALAGLPVPDAVFIGGSKGRLSDIISCVLEKNPATRIVASAVAMETVVEAQQIFTHLQDKGMLTGFEVVQISVARTRAIGSYHLMTAQNPITLFCARGAWESKDAQETGSASLSEIVQKSECALASNGVCS